MENEIQAMPESLGINANMPEKTRLELA